MHSSVLKTVMLAVCLMTNNAVAQTLALPEALINFNSERGARLLIQSKARAAYWPLSIQFVTQKNQVYCGVATMVMVLNALGVPAPATSEVESFRFFTQENVLNEHTEKIHPQSILNKKGMTLDQLGKILSTYGVKAQARHATDSGLDEFRAIAIQHLETPSQHVIVNYLRSAIGQGDGGHISPLAAYDADTDRFLVLDVSRYKYPPVWVEAVEQYRAMNTVVQTLKIAREVTSSSNR